MATRTPNLGLIKPAGGDQYNIAEHNENMDILDLFSTKTPSLPIDAEDVTVTTLGALGVGSTFTIPVGGVPTEFIVVHHGKPSAMYDDSFNGGTICLMRDVLPNRQWHSSNVNDYANSTIHAWLNGDFYNTIDASVRGQMRQVRVPYRVGSSGSTVNSGASGLLCRVFLPSFYELSGGSTVNVATDGAVWTHFSGIENTGGSARRAANRSGSAATWWLRSPIAGNSTSVLNVSGGGALSNEVASSTAYGPRPAFVLPSDFTVNTTTTVADALADRPTRVEVDGMLQPSGPGFVPNTEWIELYRSANNVATFYRGIQNTIQVFVTFFTILSGSTLNLGTLPIGFRPLSASHYIHLDNSPSGSYMNIQTNGQIRASANAGINGSYFGSFALLS